MRRRHELPSQEFVARFRARVPQDVAETFTEQQLTALENAFASRAVARHRMRFALSLRLPWGRYYLVLMAGPDRRRTRATAYSMAPARAVSSRTG